jgi:hypothetical protein
LEELSITVFPVAFPSSGRSYADPVVTYKRGADRFVIAAAETSTQTLNLPDGPVSISAPSGIAVTAIGSDGTRAASRFLRTPIASVARHEKRPALIADSRSDRCCLAVAWEDEAYSTVFYLQRLDDGLVPQGDIASIAPPTAERVSNVAASYEFSRDRFTFAYDLIDRTARRFIGVSSVTAMGGGSVRHLQVAERRSTERRDELPRGTPSLAYADGLNSYLVAWRVDGTLNAAFVSQDVTSSSGVFPVPPPVVCTRFPCFLGPSAAGRPRVVAVPGAARAVVLAPMLPFFGTTNVLTAYAVTSSAVPPTIAWRASLSRTADGSVPAHGAAFVPSTGRIVAAWEGAGPTSDIWVDSAAP